MDRRTFFSGGQEGGSFAPFAPTPVTPLGLHVIHGAFKTGAESTDWKMKKILKVVFQILHDNPARREEYKSITGCDVHPLNFCATR